MLEFGNERAELMEKIEEFVRQNNMPRCGTSSVPLRRRTSPF